MSHANRAVFLTEEDDLAYAQAIQNVRPDPIGGAITYEAPDPVLVSKARKHLDEARELRNHIDAGAPRPLDSDGDE